MGFFKTLRVMNDVKRIANDNARISQQYFKEQAEKELLTETDPERRESARRVIKECDRNLKRLGKL